MRAVIQKVTFAEVHEIKNNQAEHIAKIALGYTVLLGVASQDREQDARYIVDKIASLRIFEDEDDKLNLSIEEVHGEILLISQFTLLGDVRKGRRPSYSNAARPELALQLYEYVANLLREKDITVKTGRFQTHMRVSIDNDGPVTIILDSQKLF